MKRNWYFLAIVMAAIILVAPSFVAAENSKDQENKFGLEIGWKYFNVQHEFSHNTHPDDSFLSKARVPGSAGTTTIDGANFLAIGLGYESPRFSSFTFQVSAGGLIGGNSDNKQNFNDPRPAANGAFIYSEAQYGLYVSASLLYHLDPFYIGPEAQIAGIKFDEGWDRFSSHESVSSSWEAYPSFGGKAGLAIQNFRIEGSAHYGKCLDAGMSLRYLF